MEIANGVIFDRGQVEIDGEKRHSYLVAAILITDQELTNLNGSETIVMGANQFQNLLTEGLEGLNKYKLPYKTLGDISNAIIAVSTMDPTDLEPCKPKKKKR